MLIPFCQAWGSLFMSISWVVYGILITEIYVVIPHCINIVLATAQIILFLNYRRKYPIFNENAGNSSIGLENEENKNEEQKEKEEIKEDNETNPVKIMEKENI